MAERPTPAQKTQKSRSETQRDRDGSRNTRTGAQFLRAKTSSHGRLKK